MGSVARNMPGGNNGPCPPLHVCNVCFRQYSSSYTIQYLELVFTWAVIVPRIALEQKWERSGPDGTVAVETWKLSRHSQGGLLSSHVYLHNASR